MSTGDNVPAERIFAGFHDLVDVFLLEFGSMSIFSTTNEAAKMDIIPFPPQIHPPPALNNQYPRKRRRLSRRSCRIPGCG
jgi:hypothetical protein